MNEWNGTYDSYLLAIVRNVLDSHGKCLEFTATFITANLWKYISLPTINYWSEAADPKYNLTDP